MKKTLSIQSLHRDITSQRHLHNRAKIQQFVPFVKERNLGKLLSKQSSLMSPKLRADSLDSVNSRNFEKKYRLQRMQSERQYAKKIRQPMQSNLIGCEWKVRSISKNRLLPTIESAMDPSKVESKKDLRAKMRSCCFQSPNAETIKTAPKFYKINMALYKKIACSEPPESQNDFVNELFRHYVATVELNENERRAEMTRSLVRNPNKILF